MSQANPFLAKWENTDYFRSMKNKRTLLEIVSLGHLCCSGFFQNPDITEPGVMVN